MRFGHRSLGLAAFGVALALAGAPAQAEDAGRDYLQLGVGYSDLFDDDDTAAEFGALYRFNPRYLDAGLDPGHWWQGVGPQLGGGLNTEGAGFGRAGLFLDLRPGERLVIWPSAGVLAYAEGDGRDLGGTFQFIEEFYVGYRLPWNHLLGASIAHISNAGIHDRNPGNNIGMISYTVPLGPLF